MSSYSARVALDSPVLYFENNSSGVNNTGSRTPTITTGGSNTFNTTGGIGNTPYITVGARTGTGYGFEYSDSTTTFNDKAFTISGWLKVASADISTSLDWIFHTGTSADGLFLQKTDRLYIGSILNSVQVDDSGSSAVSYDTWHHIALTVDSTNIKLYIDGSLVDTGSTPSTISMDSQVKYWMRQSTGRNGVKGNFDEWAVFDSTLSSTTIAEHYAAGFAVDYAAPALTASALLVQPALILDGGYSAEASTASALFAPAIQSALDDPTLLDEYMATLSLEQWYRFDQDNAIANYGSGGDPGFGLTGTVKTYPTAGLQGIGALEISGGYLNGQATSLQSATWNTELQDQSFTAGVWVKVPSAYSSIGSNVNIFNVQKLDASSYISVNMVNGVAGFDFRTNQNHSIYSTTNIADNQWHFIAVKMTPPGGSNGSATIYIDGVQEGTTTYNGNVATFEQFAFSAGNATRSERFLVAQYFVAPSSMSTTVLENIYEYGTNSVVQAGARMIEPRIKFNNKYNDLNESLGAIFDYRFDEGVNAINNFGTYGSLSITATGTTPEYLKPTKNRYGKKELSTDTNWGAGWTAATGTFSSANQQTIISHLKVDDKSSTVTRVLFSSGIFGGGYGSGMMFLQATSTGYLRFRMNNGASNYVLNTTYDIADGKWHHVAAVKDGSSIKLYVDGKEIGSGTSTINLSDNGILWVGGETTLFGSATEAKSVTYDEFQVFADAFTAQEMFEHYQSMTIDGPTAVTSLMVSPTVSAGFGPTISETPATATTSMGPVFPPIAPMSSEAMFLNPNYEATDVVTITSDVFTASALLEDPTFDIGENNGAQHMDASAEFPEPRVLIPGKWNASPAIANPALMVEPALSTTLGARIVAQSMPVKAIFPTPPAYKLISDDMWYSKLYLQHSVVHGETGNTAGVSSAYAFMKLFDDVTQNLSGAATNKLTNNLPYSIVVDSPTNTASTITYANGSSEFLTATPTPVLEVGTYDDYERKSVRFRNIQFTIPEDVYVADRAYSLEFTFKTTKSNQVIAQGLQKSFLYYQSATSSIGLIDGKLYASRVTQEIGKPRVFAHPDNKDIAFAMNTAYGNKRIDDGAWHHLIIQYGFDGRVQFWIDGQLDIQFFADSKLGRGAQIRPYIIGSNHTNSRWQSDFETSAWSYDAAFFVDSDEITDHYTASIKYEPVHAEPATATADLGQDTKAEGNRPRALMLYFWPTDPAQIRNQSYSNFTSEGPEVLTTLDYFTKPPQEYEGWDVFPVDVTGYWVSDLVKKEAYGVDNIGSTNFIKYVSTWQDTKNAPYALFNKRGTFRDLLTDAPRYIDLINDIDLSKFDMIMFKNYPNDPGEKDAFSTNEVVDAYFNLRESKIFEDFVKSLRAAVDTGLSLVVTNAQLALDLKIVDRVETVPDMDGIVGDESDPYAPTQVPQASSLPTTGYPGAGWRDTWKNNRARVVNTHPGLTDNGGLIRTQFAFYRATDEIRYGEPDRVFSRYEHKDALSVGDEFLLSTFKAYDNKTNYLSAPIANVKAGKVITAFANTVRRGLDEIENPYKDYAISLIITPGTVLDGKQVGGKIYVNFTEDINESLEEGAVDLISDFWVNYAYDNGAITLERKNELLAAEYNQDATQYWSSDGMNVLLQASVLEVDENFNKKGVQRAAAKVRKVNKSGGISFQNVASGSQFFALQFSYRYPRATFEVPSILTNGFRWLSNREVLEGTVIRPEAFAATAQMPNALGVPDKVTSFNAQSMAATATIVETEFSTGEKKILVLPATATATIVKPGSTIGVAPMTANAILRINSKASVASEDQVTLYLIHVDPILYIREDVIK